MALAYKCDRCGKHYDYYDDTFNNIGLRSRRYDGFNTTVDVFDLCPNCHDELVAWLDYNNVNNSPDIMDDD